MMYIINYIKKMFLLDFMVNFNSYLDYALPNQFGFQFPGNLIARGIIDLHNHIMFFLVFIVIFTFLMIYFTVNTFTIASFNDVHIFNKIKKYYNIKILHHTMLECIWIIVPSLILLCIAIPSFALLYAMEISGNSFMTMKVIGHQWYWSYSFVFGIESPNIFYNSFINKNLELGSAITVNIAEFGFDSYMVPTNELNDKSLRLLETTNPVVLPVDTYIKVYVTSSDVLHSWTVPSLGIKIDACPGRLNQVNLFINRIGHFYGQCSELCGVNHGFMPIEIYSIKRDDYITYLSLVCQDFRNNNLLQINHFYLYFYEEASISMSLINYTDYDFKMWWKNEVNSVILDMLKDKNIFKYIK